MRIVDKRMRWTVAWHSVFSFFFAAIVVVAAGSGTRLAAGSPKAFVGLEGHTILRRCLSGVFGAAPAQVIVVAPEDRLGEALTEAHAAADAADAACSAVKPGSSAAAARRSRASASRRSTPSSTPCAVSRCSISSSSASSSASSPLRSTPR